MEYASVVWDPHYQCDIDKLRNVQRAAALYVKCYFYVKRSGMGIPSANKRAYAASMKLQIVLFMSKNLST